MAVVRASSESSSRFRTSRATTLDRANPSRALVKVRVMGIDPGSRTTGWGVVEARGSRIEAIEWGELAFDPAQPLARRLSALADGCQRLLERFQPDRVAIERVFHGENTRSLIVLAEARGALLASIAKTGAEVVELAPATIKSAITGSGRADKRQVERMVRLQLGLPAARISPDASDALAAAIAVGCGVRASFETEV
jgi:crossover junction endodeoxyribonuclease RuvC